MNKRLLSLFVFVIFMFGCVGCMPSGTQLFSVYLLPDGSGPDIFRDDIPTAERIPVTSNSTAPQDPAPTAEVLFGESLMELKLVQPQTDPWYVYVSEDGMLTCGLEPQNGTLRFISAEAWLDPKQARTMSEDDYIDWIQALVSRYYTEDWSEYTAACTTEIRGSITDSEKLKTEKGFRTAAESYETVASYTFTFIKYLGEYATSDVIRAYIRPETGYLELEFSAHAFDNTEPMEIDPELIQATVFQFLSDSIAETRYSYTRHSSSLPTLTYINGHLCYVCTVRIDVLSLDDIQKFENEEVLQPVAIVLN